MPVPTQFNNNTGTRKKDDTREHMKFPAAYHPLLQMTLIEECSQRGALETRHTAVHRPGRAWVACIQLHLHDNIFDISLIVG